jgi:photosystem II stability/assembly factor-like uncharacterized protein
MRLTITALAVTAALVAPARANDLRNFEDAALHAVQFVDKQEGWAVGDEGVVWHTIDGGSSWERQPTAVRASLRSLHFLNPYTGWVAGREELPHGGSVGVLLFTQDGGLRWQRTGRDVLPGLNRVRFLDNKTGFITGDGTDQFPSGVFTTSDSGRTWRPVPGPRGTSWLAADFQDGQTGALAGTWSRLATLREGALGTADVDTVGGRSVTALQLMGQRALAVGQGGLVLVSRDSAGARWGYADIGLPAEVRAAWDFTAMHWVGDQVWVVGRPGSRVLHSADAGKTWDVRATSQPLPLNGVFFSDDQQGWAVGELGCILSTRDGGKSWAVQRRGGQRCAALFVHARPAGLPLDTVALLGGQESYLVACVGMEAADPASAAPGLAFESGRFAAAVRQAGGAAGEVLWQFPLPQHLARSNKTELLHAWDRLHDDQAAQEILRQMVLAIRTWRPDVVITDHPDEKATGCPDQALLAEAVHEAFRRANDPKSFPEQLKTLGLEAWQPSKLYAQWDTRAGAQVVLELNEPSPRLGATLRDFAMAATGLLLTTAQPLPGARYYRLIDSQLADATQHRDLLGGIVLQEGGVARRKPRPLAEPEANVVKAIRARRNLEAIAENSLADAAQGDQLVAQVGPILQTLPDDQGGAAAFALANQYARMGQWPSAREMYQLMVDRYPMHPLAADAYRWLIRYHASSEARHRQELGQFLVTKHSEFRISPNLPSKLPKGGLKQVAAEFPTGTERLDGKTVALLTRSTDIDRWYKASLEIGDRLAALGPLHAGDPSVQFSLQAARRNLGDFEAAQKWYASFCKEQPPGPWRDAAATELWLVHRAGRPPKPVWTCRQTETRPVLDGTFDDPCWKDLKPLVLANAVGDTSKEFPTEVRLAYDQNYLYLALKCQHPENRYVPPVKVRSHDADLHSYDRISLLLDLDRDYATFFDLQVDQRGCVCDDCWGDRSWNPRWFVAIHSDKTCWQIEAAIPMVELTGEPVSLGRAWACNAVRVIPGRGVQALATPADVRPRPEGMGLLMFTQEPRRLPKAISQIP